MRGGRRGRGGGGVGVGGLSTAQRRRQQRVGLNMIILLVVGTMSLFVLGFVVYSNTATLSGLENGGAGGATGTGMPAPAAMQRTTAVERERISKEGLMANVRSSKKLSLRRRRAERLQSGTDNAEPQGGDTTVREAGAARASLSGETDERTRLNAGRLRGGRRDADVQQSQKEAPPASIPPEEGPEGKVPDAAQAHVKDASMEGRKKRPSDSSRKQEGTSQEYTCADGQVVTALGSAFNDNYCDCKDGSDEPFTDACSLLHTMFKCKSGEKRIFSSRVNDGICDCRDGSDEWAHPELCMAF